MIRASVQALPWAAAWRLSLCAFGAKHPSLITPRLKANSQLNQTLNELTRHLNPFSEQPGVYLGQGAKQLQRGI